MMRLMHAAGGLALLALAGCGGRAAAPAPAPALPGGPDAQQAAECRAEARRSPAVRALEAQLNPANLTNVDRVRAEQREAESRAYVDCLRRRGLARGGGVEPVRRPMGM